MGKLVLLTYNIRQGRSESDYERYLREVDYPVFRARPEILEYSTWKLVRAERGSVPFRFFDTMRLAEFQDFERVLHNPTVEEHAKGWVEEWSEYGPDRVASSEPYTLWGGMPANSSIYFCEEIG